MASEREETLVEQLQLRDAYIVELKAKLEEAITVMEDLAKAGGVMIDLWQKQQARLVILEAAVRGPLFPDKDAK